jgi:hypothetical protein
LNSKDKDNVAPQSSSTPASTTTGANLGSENSHQTPPPTTTAGQETNGGVTQAEGQDTNGGGVAQAERQDTNGGEDDDVIIHGEDPYPNGKRGKRCTSQVW